MTHIYFATLAFGFEFSPWQLLLALVLILFMLFGGRAFEIILQHFYRGR